MSEFEPIRPGPRTGTIGGENGIGNANTIGITRSRATSRSSISHVSRGRSLRRARTNESTASASVEHRRFRLTHVHSHHLDDAGVYQDRWHDSDEEDKDETTSHDRQPQLARHQSQPQLSPQSQHDGASERASIASSESTINFEPESVNEDVTGVATADLEKAESRREIQRRQTSRSLKEKDPNLVTWDGPDDPANPKNWTKREKWVATFVVSSFTFISPVSSSLVAPAIGSMVEEFGVTPLLGQMMLSIFILAYAVGPLVIGPLSEIYGRVRVLQLANLVFLIFNAACGGATSPGMLIAFRFLAGFGGSAPLAIGGGVLSDAWRTEERGAAIAIYSLMPLIGPAVGPICGGFITQYSSWRWGFYATSIADAVIQISGLFFLRETYPPEILHRRVLKLRKETGNEHLYTEYEDPNHSITSHLGTALIRPFRMLLTQPMIQVLALYMAFLYGSMYLLLSSFPLLWHDRYGQSISMGGLNYIAIGIGFAGGAQFAARLQDRIYARLSRSRGVQGKGRPEFRVPLMVPGALLTPIGLLIYGWTAQYQTHWIGPDIGAAIFSLGTIMGFQCIQTFLVDTYARYAASAIAAATVLRSLAGFAFPLFAPEMYEALDFGWGNSLLALVAIVLGFPAPFLLWKFGPMLRNKSTFAAGS